CNTETATHHGHVRRLGVRAATRGGYALDVVDDGRALMAVLEADAQGGLAVLVGLFERLEVTLVYEQPCEGRLELARRHINAGVAIGDRVADAGEHICDWVRLHLPSSVGVVSAQARRPWPRDCFV